MTRVESPPRLFVGDAEMTNDEREHARMDAELSKFLASHTPYIHKWVTLAEDREDVRQDFCAAAWSRRHVWRGLSLARPYLFRILYHTVVNFYRSRKNSLPVINLDPDVVGVVDHPDRRQLWSDCGSAARSRRNPLGWGEYRWVIAGDFQGLDVQTVLAVFLYGNGGELDGKRNGEIDFEFSRWGKKTRPNTQFVVAPATKESMHMFESHAGNVMTVSLLWREGLVRGQCWIGEDVDGKKPHADWSYSGPKVPDVASAVAPHINFWLASGDPPQTRVPQEIVVRSFRFEPIASRNSSAP